MVAFCDDFLWVVITALHFGEFLTTLVGIVCEVLIIVVNLIVGCLMLDLPSDSIDLPLQLLGLKKLRADKSKSVAHKV